MAHLYIKKPGMDILTWKDSEDAISWYVDHFSAYKDFSGAVFVGKRELSRKEIFDRALMLGLITRPRYDFLIDKIGETIEDVS